MAQAGEFAVVDLYEDAELFDLLDTALHLLAYGQIRELEFGNSRSTISRTEGHLELVFLRVNSAIKFSQWFNREVG
jgi:hypothetical protein